MEAASREAPSVTTPRRDRKTGEGIWTGALVIIAVAAVGLLVSAAILYAELVQGANSAHRTAMVSAAADRYAGFFEARVTALEAQLDAAAEAPATVEALASYDTNRLAERARTLTQLLPYAERVALFPKGSAAVELNAEVPISYAAVELIQLAETTPFAGPEGIKLDNQRTRFHAARPVTSDGSVIGVLFVALSADFLLEPLEAFQSRTQQVLLQQTVPGSAPVVLLQVGESGPAPADDSVVRRALAVENWQLLVAPNAAAIEPVAHASSLYTAMAVALGLLLGGVMLGFSRLSRSMKHDANVLLEQTGSTLRGQRQLPQRYRLAAFYDLAREIARMAGARDPAHTDPAASSRASAAQSRSAEGADEETVDALLQGEAEKSARHQPPPAAAGTSARAEGPAAKAAPADDFLEVSRTSDAGDNFGIEVTEDTSPMAMGLDLQPEIFRSYDIRGITTSNLTEEVVYWIGRAFAAEAADHGQRRVAVGRDGRHSSAPLAESLCRGLTEGGVDVLDIGQVPTPVLYFANHVLETGTGIMITGSHNPPEYNGLKMVLAGETLAEERIQALRQRIEENRLSEGEGDVEAVDVAGQYLTQIADDVVVAQPLKVVVDCGNGVAGRLAPELVSQLGCEVVPLYCDVDGEFPNHHPDPAEPENLEDLITVVKAEHADLGLAFDGDGDRLGVVTASGEIIWPDKLLMLYAQDIVGRNPGADIIYDVKCSRHLAGLIGDLGGRPIMWKTGHSHIKAKLKETGALLAGEFSGHICFGERWYGFDDALYAAARLLEILGGTEASADELFAQFPVTYSTPEIKIQTTEQRKFEVMERLAAEGDFGAGTVTAIDGVRVDYPDGWGLIRPSNTSPVLSLRFEADGQEALSRIQEIFSQQLSAIDPELTFR